MPRIVGVSTAVPPYRVDQQTARQFAANLFGRHRQDLDRLLDVFAHAGIDSRYFSCPLDWFAQPHSLEEKNTRYIESATDLSITATASLLSRLGIPPEQIDYVIYVNTTGLATPSIDARLINRMNLRRDIRRTPIWGLGCAGGAAGLAHAYHYLLGHPNHRVLLVACELCGLTFLPDDFSKSNLVACALFGEGAAAVLLSGDQVDAQGLDILATRSWFYPDSLDVMGWNIVSQGLQVLFARRIPDIVAANARAERDQLLADNHLTLDDLHAYLMHPGGTKVVEAYELAWDLRDGQMDIPRTILREYGNMSSVSVLFVLNRYLAEQGVNNPGYGLIGALGPGFCSESVIVKL